MAAKKTSAKRKTTVKRKTTAKKPTRAKKTTAKKKTTRSTTKKKAVAKKISTYRDPLSKTQILNTISEDTELTRKQVSAVLDSLTDIIEGHVKKRAAGTFTLPGLLKIVVNHKPATKARKGINPFTGEETMFKAKPARNVVKVRALKKLKDMVN